MGGFGGKGGRVKRSWRLEIGDWRLGEEPAGEEIGSVFCGVGVGEEVCPREARRPIYETPN